MLENILKNNNDNKENKNKKNVPHWLSTTEKLRNYIPEIIPSLNRFIYFDNDIIITKENILYDLWNYNIGDSPLGLVGNALHPAEYDIINNFYDLDDPFIQKSFHFYPNITHPTLTKKILQTILPIYPNNGVMLVNATKWRELNISSTAREVESHYHKMDLSHKLNSQVVNVLTLHKYWAFLPQGFNLRVSGSGKAEHACRIRKGIGILHFAGSYKPHNHCNATAISPKAEYNSLIIDYLHDTCPHNQDAFPLICYNLSTDIQSICGKIDKKIIIEPIYCDAFRGKLY